MNIAKHFLSLTAEIESTKDRVRNFIASYRPQPLESRP